MLEKKWAFDKINDKGRNLVEGIAGVNSEVNHENAGCR